MSREATSPGSDDPEYQIVWQAVEREPERGAPPTSVRYTTGLFWLSTVGLVGLGGALASASPVGGVFMALGGCALAALIQAKRIGERALVIDDEGIAHTGLWGTRYRVPWSEISGARAGEYGVVVELQAPRAQFRVPPREVRRKRGRRSLLLQSLAISGEKLVERIQAHLQEAADAGERTSKT